MTFLTHLWRYIEILAPFFLLGLAFSGLIKAMVPPLWVAKVMGGASFCNIFKAALVGIPLPLCSCAVVPTAVALKKDGAGTPALSSFVISTPETGVDSIVLTWGLMGWPMVALRVAAAFFTAISAGIAQFFFNPEQTAKGVIKEKSSSCCGLGEGDASKDSTAKKSGPNFMKRLWSGQIYAFGPLLDNMALWLAFGILAGAGLNAFLPEDIFQGLGANLGRLTMLAIGLPLYVCASASTPLALSLLAKGLSPGTALIFLLVGPATNLSNLAVLRQVIGNRGVMINVAVIVICSLLLSYLADFLYAHFALPRPWDSLVPQASHHHQGQSWTSLFFSLSFLALLLKGLYFEEVKKRMVKKTCCGSN